MEATRILVVDDEPDVELLLKQKFRKEIREGKMSFVFAENGNRALEVLDQDNTIEIVLSDINMPEMDGLTLLSILKERNLLLKSIIVSAYGDMDNIRTAMNNGAFDFITKPIDFEDLEKTISKTKSYVEQLKLTMQAIHENNILKMYVDQTALNFMTNQEFENAIVQNETVEATVVFVDICDFTSLSERLKPDEVVSILNQYFDVMVEEIIAQNGYIDKFIGDAVMAVFKGEYHLDRAMEASLTLKKKLSTLSPIVEGIESSPKVSIGINSGNMVSGNIGSQKLKRYDYTVIGDVVNTAQRLQSEAGPNQILITKNAYDKISQYFKCQEIGMRVLKNKQEAIMVYEVLD